MTMVCLLLFIEYKSIGHIMKISHIALSFLSGLSLSFSAQAGLQFQHYVAGMQGVDRSVVADSVDAAIVTPRGLTCELPTKDGYCTIPLVWLTNLDSPASLWRGDKSGSNIRVAHGFDGVLSAYVRYQQSLTYSLHRGGESSGKLMDQAVLTAMWNGHDGAEGPEDPEGPGEPVDPLPIPVKSGTLDAANEGACTIYADFQSCEVSLNWTSKNVSSARIWERTASGLKMVADASGNSGTLSASAYDKATIYELHEGTDSTGKLLAAAVTKGNRTSPLTGSIELPDGKTCITTRESGVCEILVKWQTNDLGRVWVREKSYSQMRASGQSYVQVGIEGGFVDLRSGQSSAGAILAREKLQAEIGEHSGTLRAHDAIECTASYQGGSCSLSLDYTASERSSIWNDTTQTRLGGGTTGDTISVPVLNHDGAITSENVYSLRVHGGGAPRYSNPVLARIRLNATRPGHSGRLDPVTIPSCNMLYSKTACNVGVKVTTSSPVASAWNEQGEKLWQGTNLGTFSATVHEGKETVYLRDGTLATNTIINTIELSALRPSYYARLSTIGDPACTSNVYSGTCSVTLKVESNTTSAVFYRDISGETPGAWISLRSSIPSGTSSNTVFSRSAIIDNKQYEFEIRQQSSPYEPLDALGPVDVFLNAPQTLTMTNPSPFYSSDESCSTYYNSTWCYLTVTSAWSTNAPTVTQCWYDGGLSASAGQTFTSHRSSSANYPIRVGQVHTMAMIEGSVTCPSVDNFNSVRVMWSGEIKPPTVVPANETPASFTADTASCLMVYVGYGHCMGTATYSMSMLGLAHSAYPYLYINNKKTGTVFANFQTSASARSGSAGIRINEDEKDVVYQLRARAGATASDSDPVLDEITLNFTRQDLTGDIFLARVRDSNSTYTQDSYYVNPSTTHPYFFSRGVDKTNYSDVSQPCVIHIAATSCMVNLYSRFDQQSGGGSIWIDGEYYNSFTNYIPNGVAWQALSLALGVHTIELREGLGASSINNKLIDSFSISVERPEYVGSINLVGNLPKAPYMGSTVSVSFDISSNTEAYLFNKQTGAQVCALPIWYTSNQMPAGYGKRTCSQTLTKGKHSYELRSRVNPQDASNIIFDSYDFEIIDDDQSTEVAPSTFASQVGYFNHCDRTYYSQQCFIYFSYKNSRAYNNGNSLSACIKNEDSSYTKLWGGASSENWTNGSISLNRDSATIFMVNGPACPLNEAEEGLKIMTQWDVTSSAPETNLSVNVVPYSNWQLIKSETESDTWTCFKRYYGDICQFTIQSSYPAADNKTDQHAMAYLGLRDETNYITGVTTPLLSSTVAIDTSTPEKYYNIVSCSSSPSAYYCTLDPSRFLKKILVKTVLPVYSGKITTESENDYCQAAYKGTTCTMKFNISTTSGLVSLYRDGVSIGTLGSKNGVISNNLPVKERGEKTIIELYDGNGKSGLLLDTIEVVADPYDPNRFKFNHASPNSLPDVLLEDCILSGYVKSEESRVCRFRVPFSSDSSKKYIKFVGLGSAGTTEVSGNGVFEVVAPAVVGRYFVNDEDTGYIYKAEVYSDEGLTQLMDILEVRRRSTALGDIIISSSGSVLEKSGIYVDVYSSYKPCWNCYTSYSYYLIFSLGIPLYNGDVAADDLVLSTPGACTQTRSTPYGGDTKVCNAIGYSNAKKTMPRNSFESFSVNYSGEKKVKRIFYKAIINNNLSDLSITVGGVVRPLPMDGAWHYLDMGETTSGSIEFSALNANEESEVFGVSVFAEYYTPSK